MRELLERAVNADIQLSFCNPRQSHGSKRLTSGYENNNAAFPRRQDNNCILHTHSCVLKTVGTMPMERLLNTFPPSDDQFNQISSFGNVDLCGYISAMEPIREIRFEDSSPAAVEAVIRYIYLGQPPVLEPLCGYTVRDLMSLASYLEIESLQDHCVELVLGTSVGCDYEIRSDRNTATRRRAIQFGRSSIQTDDVLIVGGGIVGLSLGVMLERAGIDYLILEACNEVRPLGSVVTLGPPVLRVFEQLGLLEDITRQSNRMTGVALFDHKLNKVCCINMDYAKDRYGYDTLTIVRPKLHDILLSRIPAYKILFGMRVVSMAQNSEGVKVRCEDGSICSGDIIVAADGGASPIRKAIYGEIKTRSKKLPHPADYAQPKLDQRCIAGVSEILSVKQYPILGSKNCELTMLMPKDTNCMIWIAPVAAERRFSWGITSPLPSLAAEASSSDGTKSGNTTRDSLESGYSTPATRTFSAMSNTSYSPPSPTSSLPNPAAYNEARDYMSSMNSSNQSSISNYQPSNAVKKRQSTGRLSKHSSSSGGSQKAFQQYPTVLQLYESNTLDLKELPNDRVWGKLDEKFTIEDSIREQPTPFGCTLGDIIEVTSKKMISTVVVEEKFYHIWHLGRTVLMGDACHKLLPSSGHGATQGILDAISLASLLAELPSNSLNDIDALFRVQYERRGPSAKAAVISSQQQDQLLFNRKLSGKIIRKMASSWLTGWMIVKMGDRIFETRPMLPFLKSIPDRGTHKNRDNTIPLMKDKRFEMARRKSIASGYLIGGTGSFKLGGKDDEEAKVMEMEFDISSFSSSTPEFLTPPVPSLPMNRPMSPMMDIEGTLIPMSSRPGEKYPEMISARNSHWHLIVSILRSMPNLIELNATWMNVDLLESLVYLQNLERLSISRLQGSYSEENMFFEPSFQGSKLLKELCMTDSSQMTDKALASITRTCPQIQVLIVSGNNCLTHEGLIGWCRWLSSLEEDPKSSSVYGSVAPGINPHLSTTMTALTTINFKNCNRIQSSGFQALFERSHHLEDVNLMSTRVEDAALKNGLPGQHHGGNGDITEAQVNEQSVLQEISQAPHIPIISDSQPMFYEPQLEFMIFGEPDLRNADAHTPLLAVTNSNISVGPAVYATNPNPLELPFHTHAVSSTTLQEYRRRLISAQVYRQIGQLLCLQILDIRDLYLPLDLASGLERLGGLYQLKILECTGLENPMGVPEVNWLLGLRSKQDIGMIIHPLPSLRQLVFKKGYGIPSEYLQTLREHRPLLDIQLN
ncbi:hypothetical protein BGX27_000045 [Mortierella sp. AM989]|nr:hypothetical protein BGX27_000045 [Mortierella sp. AM989]